MESFPFQSILESAPSPSFSDDSGYGMSPNPLEKISTPYFLESPTDSDLASKTFAGVGVAENTAPFNAFPYNIQQQDASCTTLLGEQTTSIGRCDNSENDQNEIDLVLQNFIASLPSPSSPTEDKTNTKKTSQKIEKRATTDQTDKLSFKRENCLLPKTGNCKPRQTSTKRKMNASARNGTQPYPGVRPKTVREKLEQMRQKMWQETLQQQERPNQLPCPPVTPQQASTQSYSSKYGSSGCTGNIQMMEPPPPGNSSHAHQHPVSPPVPNYPSSSPPSYMHDAERVPDLVDLYDPVGVAPAMQTQNPTSYMAAIASSAPQGHITNYSEPNIAQSMWQVSSVSPRNAEFASPAPFFDTSCPPQPTVCSTVCPVTCGSYDPSPGFSSCTYVSSPQMFEHCFPSDVGFAYFMDNDSESCHPSLHELAANGCLNELQARFSKISTGNTAIQSVVNESDRSGMTLLLCATKKNQLDVVKYLLDQCGANPCHYANDGQNVLHLAATLQDHGILDFLCRRIPASKLEALVNDAAALEGGRTPLHLATQNRKVRNMIILMQNGANLSAKEQKNGWTALHMAVKNADVDATREILSFAAYGLSARETLTSRKARDLITLRKVACQETYNNNTALHFAAELPVAPGDVSMQQAQATIINLLLDNEANKSLRNHQNQLPHNLLSSSNAQLQERLRNTRNNRCAQHAPYGAQQHVGSLPMPQPLAVPLYPTAPITGDFSGHISLE